MPECGRLIGGKPGEGEEEAAFALGVARETIRARAVVGRSLSIADCRFEADATVDDRALLSCARVLTNRVELG